jgi:hypothetical protein
MAWVPFVAFLLAASALSSFTFVQVQSQQASDPMQDSWPQVYPGMPTGDYSPEWQSCAFWYNMRPPSPFTPRRSRRLSGDGEPSKRDMAACSELGRQYPRSESGSSERHPVLLGVRVFGRVVYCEQ